MATCCFSFWPSGSAFGAWWLHRTCGTPLVHLWSQGQPCHLVLGLFTCWPTAKRGSVEAVLLEVRLKGTRLASSPVSSKSQWRGRPGFRGRRNKWTPAFDRRTGRISLENRKASGRGGESWSFLQSTTLAKHWHNLTNLIFPTTLEVKAEILFCRWRHRNPDMSVCVRQET